MLGRQSRSRQGFPPLQPPPVCQVTGRGWAPNCFPGNPSNRTCALGQDPHCWVTSHRMENVRVLQFSESGWRPLTQNIKVSAPEKGKFCFVKPILGVWGGTRTLEVRVKDLEPRLGRVSDHPSPPRTSQDSWSLGSAALATPTLSLWKTSGWSPKFGRSEAQDS